MNVAALRGTFAPGESVPGTIYRVERVIDTGGMSVVYEVTDTALGKTFVLKALHGHLARRADFVERLAVEARTLARFKHPNIVSVIAAGVTADAQALPFFVMEHLKGKNLREVLKERGRLALVHALAIAIDVLAALEHAHANGVVHRDVKPENVYLHRASDGTTQAKLLDFGLLGFVDDVSPPEDVGATVRYASPEQLEGPRAGVAADLYAAALVVYEMIAGKGPFDAVAHGRAELAQAHLHRAAPSLLDVASDPPLSAALVALIAAALEKEPGKRPASASAFRAVLLDVHREELERLARDGDEPAPLFSIAPPPPAVA